MYKVGSSIIVDLSCMPLSTVALVATGKNAKIIKDYFKIEGDVAKFLKDSKADNMRCLCEAISEDEITIELPNHIGEIIECVKSY